MKKFKKSFILAVTSSIIISSSAFASNVSFDDVRMDQWFHEPIVELVKKGGVAGYQDGTFKPNGTITRAEFLKMAYSSATEKEYKAEKGHHWASGVHKAAMDKGIIDNSFKATSDYLNKPITREEMTTIIVNISEIIKGEPKVDTSKTASKIVDLGKVSPERKADVLQAYQKGLLAGKENGFEPQGKTTRGEAAMVIMRILDNDFRVDPDKVVEAPAGRVIKWNDPNKPLDPKVGDVFIDKNGVKHVLKEGYGVLGGGQKIDYHDGTVINGIKFKGIDEGAIGMVDTITGRDLDGQPYWVANGEGHFDSEWKRMADKVLAEFKADLKAKGIDVTTLEQGKLYHNNWIIIEGGAVNFTGGQAGFNPNNYQQGKY